MDNSNGNSTAALTTAGHDIWNGDAGHHFSFDSTAETKPTGTPTISAGRAFDSSI